MFLQAVEMFRKHRALSVHLVTVCVMFQEVREAPNLISQLEEEPEHRCWFECLSIRTRRLSPDQS